MPNRPWQVLHVLSNHEKKVAQHLQVRSVEHYLPLYSERVRWTDRTVVAKRPLFTGYVFARFEPHSRISVISTPGVLRFLGDEQCNLVPDVELVKIRIGLESGLPLRPHPAVATGTRVRVRDGAFAGVEGIVTELRKQCRVIIKLSATHQCFSLEIGVDELTVLSKLTEERQLNPASIYG